MTDDEYPPNPLAIQWRFGRGPIDWGSLPGGYQARYELSPRKIELIDGKLFWRDEVRLLMVGRLLENLGLDKVMQLGDPRAWKEAAATLPDSRA